MIEAMEGAMEEVAITITTVAMVRIIHKLQKIVNLASNRNHSNRIGISFFKIGGYGGGGGHRRHHHRGGHGGYGY